MAVANRYRGNALVMQWIYSGGTVLLSGDQKKLDIDRNIDLIDATAGNISDKEYLAGIKDWSLKISLADTGAAGSAILAAVIEGTFGTLLYGPQGTATGKPKGGIYGVVKSHKISVPFDDAVSIDLEIQKSGVALFDYGSVW
jgi:hypothetical protein